MDYLDFLPEVHRRLRPRAYLEIGVRWGHSLALSRCRSVGVDPAFGITADFRTELFPGARRLIELADRVQTLQVEALCWCGRKATHNARVVDGVAKVGPVVSSAAISARFWLGGVPWYTRRPFASSVGVP